MLFFLQDYLDNGNNKKALQEADKVLKKQTDFPCCKVLKALALMRMGREEEAQPLIDSVLNESPTDESTLQAMNIAFKELQQRKGMFTQIRRFSDPPTSLAIKCHFYLDFNAQSHKSVNPLFPSCMMSFMHKPYGGRLLMTLHT